MSGAACRRLLLALTTALGVAGCIDMTPLRDDPMDAGADARVIDPLRELACGACVFGPDAACGTEWNACQADEKCRLLTACGVDRGCLTLVDLQEQTVCALPCLDEVGIKTNTDPSIILGLQLNVCKVNRCIKQCAGSD